MNKILISIFATCLTWFCISVSTRAQECEKRPKFDKEAFVAKKNAYITAEVGLTPEEAAEFIPLCNELQQKILDVELTFRRKTRQLMLNKNLKEEDYKKILDESVEVRLKQARLEKEYYERFKKILSCKKIYKYKIADDKFKREYMRNKHRKLNSTIDSKSQKNSIKKK